MTPEKVDGRNTQQSKALRNVYDGLFPGALASRISVADYEKSLRLGGRITPMVEESLLRARTVRENTQVVVYIAGAVSGMDEATKGRYIKTAEILGSFGKSDAGDVNKKDMYFGYVPHLYGDPVKYPNVQPAEIRDINHLWSAVVADLHVNFMSPTAHGNAIELAWAESRAIPSLLINQRGNKLSKQVIGMNNVIKIIEYDDFEADGVREITSFFADTNNWLSQNPDKNLQEYFYLR